MRDNGTLEWIIGESEKFEIVHFNDIFKRRNTIESILMLWDTNSYYVNVKDKFFVINGGRRIQPTILLELSDIKPLAVKRHRRDMTLSGDDTGSESVSYMLGIEGILNGEKKELLLHISPDGTLWAWRDKR